MTKEEKKITNKELKALLFWSSIAVNDSNGGSYEEVILDVIVKLTKIFKWKADNFCVIGYKSGLLGKKLVKRLNKERGLRIKFSK